MMDEKRTPLVSARVQNDTLFLTVSQQVQPEMTKSMQNVDIPSVRLARPIPLGSTYIAHAHILGSQLGVRLPAMPVVAYDSQSRELRFDTTNQADVPVFFQRVKEQLLHQIAEHSVSFFGREIPLSAVESAWTAEADIMDGDGELILNAQGARLLDVRENEVVIHPGDKAIATIDITGVVIGKTKLKWAISVFEVRTITQPQASLNSTALILKPRVDEKYHDQNGSGTSKPNGAPFQGISEDHPLFSDAHDSV